MLGFSQYRIFEKVVAVKKIISWKNFNQALKHTRALKLLDIRLNSDENNVSVLVPSDLSAVFDTFDHNILISLLVGWSY